MGSGGKHGKRMALLEVRSAVICLLTDSNPCLFLPQLRRQTISKLSDDDDYMRRTLIPPYLLMTPQL